MFSNSSNVENVAPSNDPPAAPFHFRPGVMLHLMRSTGGSHVAVIFLSPSVSLRFTTCSPLVVEGTLGFAVFSFVGGIVLTRKVNLGFGMFVIANGIAIAIPPLLAGAALIVNHIYHTWL